MSELFSKEYLKELLQSDSLTDAAVTTAKAGFESATKKVAEGGDKGHLGSLASQILEGTSSDAVGSAAEQVLSGNRSDALHTLAGGVDQGTLKSAADEVLGKASDAAAEKSGGLFSSDYLKKILDSDSLVDSVTQHIDGIVEEKPDVADAVLAEEPVQPYSAAVFSSSQQVGQTTAGDVRQYAPPDQASLQYSGQTTQKTTYEAAPSPAPTPAQRPTRAGGVKQGAKGGLTLKKLILYACIAVIVIVFVLPALSKCVSQAVSTAGSSYGSSSYSSLPASTSVDKDVVTIVARGFVADEEGNVEYFDSADEDALVQAKKSGIEPLVGYPCVVVEDEDGYIVSIPNELMFLADFSNDGVIDYRNEKKSEVAYVCFDREEVLAWYPEAREVTEKADGLSMVLATELTADPSEMYGVGSEDHPDGLCRHAIATLAGSTYGGYFTMYCGCEGRVEYGSFQTYGYDFSTRVLSLPERFDPSHKEEAS